jgi:hypothetical protein
MAEEKSHEKKSHDQPKTLEALEMRVAELEDKLAKIYVTEEELKAYYKVSALLATDPVAVALYAYSEWPARRWGQCFRPVPGWPGGPSSGAFGKLGD